MRTSAYPSFLHAARGRAALSVVAASCVLVGGALSSQAASQSASASATRGLTEDEARRILPRADLSGLNDEQRAQFLEVAGDVFDYAGCRDTLAKCLAANVQDVHALRMAELVKALILEGGTPSRVIETVENYYASFDPGKRQSFKTNDCPVLGDAKAPVVLVEFSDYQCPHCAVAAKPLREIATQVEKGKARLCSKYFPLQGHPRARIAAGCAEYARRHGKFWQMHEILFAHQDELDDENLRSYAKQLGLDGSQMLKEVYAGRYDSAIDAQQQEGINARVQATPTIFVNGREHVLPVKLQFLQRSVEDELEWQQNRAFVYDRRDGGEKKG
jgi:protein-disulfide isomerase